MAESIGALRVELTADSARFRAEMEKARGSAKGAAQSMIQAAKRAEGESSRMWSRVSQSAQRGSITSSKALQGVSASVTAGGAAFRAAGVQAAGSTAELLSSLAGLTGGLGPVGAALIAAAAAGLAFKTTLDSVRASAEKSIEFSNRLLHATDEQTAVYSAAAAAAEEMEAADRGVSVQALRTAKAIEEANEQLRRATDERNRLRLSGTTTFLGLDISGDEKALKRAQAAVETAAARVQNLEIARTSLLETESRRRAEIEEEAARRRTELAARQAAEARAAQDALTRAAQRAEKATRDAVFRSVQQQRAQASLINAHVRAVGKDRLQAQLIILEEEERQALRAARERGESEQEVHTLFLQRRELAREEANLELREAERDLRDRVTEEARSAAIAVQDAELDSFQQRIAATNRHFDELAAEAQHDSELLAEIHRARQARITLIEREAAEERARQAERDTQRTAETVRRSAAEVAAATEQARQAYLDNLINDGTFAEGFTAQMQRVQDDLLTTGQLGANVATGMAQGLGGAAAAFATGQKDAKDAFGDFAKQFITNTIAMIAQQAILAGLTSIVSFGSSAATGSAAFSSALSSVLAAASGINGAVTYGGANAMGGDFRVGGMGGTDSTLVAFKATPGEHVSVTPGGRGGGSVPVILNNHGPPLDASARREVGPGGIERVVIDLFVADLARNGRAARAVDSHLRRNHGGGRG